ncbi:MAG TPA: mechanosensitive ion channel domain-containing protein [Pyrinomonadaceae bacterium]|jgi:small-conductance mechanosensitive channel|nr:mechanosensitive ion channel domain-containing protein [Pyrinomonadaceae bacterium]
MSGREKAEAERLKQDEEVRRALRQTGGQALKEPEPAADEEKARPRGRHRFVLGTYAVVLLALGAVLYALRLEFFDFAAVYRPPLQRLVLGAMGVVVALGAGRAVDAYLIDPLEDAASRYNLHRILRLASTVVVLLIALSVVFANWYTTVLSLGLISLVLGFALQTPIASFIGWIYILVRAPYRVGDRIKIGESTGDVIDVSYLDTTLWEFGGELLSTDHPSGRVIKFPNSDVLGRHVYNYSWPLFPYIWSEVTFHVGYESDLEFVGRTMREAVEEELGPEMKERVGVYRELLRQTPVNQLEVREHPTVIFRANQNTWIDATVRYLVEPHEAGRVKTRLIQKMLARLNAEPDRVLFPKGNMR